MGSLKGGARNAVETCMDIKPYEHVLIVTDKSRCGIGYSVLSATKRITPYARMQVLSDYEEKSTELPKRISNSLEGTDVSFWIMSGYQPPELEDEFIKLAMNGKRRHAHMPGITVEQMKSGMDIDYREVEKFTKKVYNFVSGSKEIKIEDNASNRKQTKLSLETNPKCKWVKSPGIIRKGQWDNLPGGEVFTAPYRVNGSVSTDLLGYYFDAKYGIQNPPVHFEIEDSRVLLDTLDCRRDLNKDLSSCLKKDKNSNRIGELGLPTNYELIPKPIIGSLLQDEKARTHIGIGDPDKEETGADWESKMHIDCILEGCDISVDDRPLMKNGKYVFTQ